MKLRVLFTFILGVMGIFFLLLSKIEVLIFPTSLISSFAGVIGSFWGIWNFVSLLFKNISLTSKEKLYLAVGTFLSLLSFALGRYGMMIVFWLPGTLVSIIILKVIQNTLNKTTTSIMNPLQDKINKMEEQLQRDKQLPPVQ